MNMLIETFFGDGYITLECDSGECLHYSQVPGYVVSLVSSRSVYFSNGPFRSLLPSPTTVDSLHSV